MTVIKTFHEIPLHYDIDSGYLTYDEFLVSAHSVKTVLDNLIQELFNSNPRYEIVILPPEDGSFLQSIAIMILTGVVLSPISDGITKSLVNHGINLEQIAETTTDKVIEATSKIGKKIRKKRIKKHEAAELVAKCATNFLQMSASQLKRKGITTTQFHNALQAKNDLYKMCIENQEIKGLGFDRKESFPVTRPSFQKHITAITPKRTPKPKWNVELQDVVVISPVWEKEERHWTGRYSKNRKKKKASFSIEDAQFWQLVESDKLKVKTKDNLRVQWASEIGKPPHRFRVLRVLEYNGQKISTKLTTKELNKVLNNFETFRNDQLELFSDS